MTDPKDPSQAPAPWSQAEAVTPPPPPPSTADPSAPLWPPATSAPTPVHDVPVSPVTTVRPAARRRRGIVDVVLVLATIFAVSGVGFAIGRVTAPAAAAATTGRGNGQFQGNGQLPGNGTGANGGQGGFGLGAGGITISGDVVEVTADHLTLKLASGQTVEIGLSGTTTYHSQAAATAADVTVGSTVNVEVGRVGRGGGTGGTGGPAASGAPGIGGAFGSASDVTVVPK